VLFILNVECNSSGYLVLPKISIILSSSQEYLAAGMYMAIQILSIMLILSHFFSMFIVALQYVRFIIHCAYCFFVTTFHGNMYMAALVSRICHLEDENGTSFTVLT